MGVDRPDDSEMPSFADGSSDRSGRSASDTPTGRTQVETEVRDRCSYYESLRVAVPDGPAEDCAASVRRDGRTAETLPSGESWSEAADRFRLAWAEHRARWPESAREPVDRSGDPPGSWRGESGRYLDSAANAEVEKRCDQIAEAERNVISPAMREIEACDPSRQLVGFEHRLKGQDRIKDKVAEDVHFKSRAPDVALANVKDTVRYTFEYDEPLYTTGVLADIERLKEQGFEQVELRNSWKADCYKGINSRWWNSDAGLLCEVQFHTRVSFEAKQLTHCAYERLRNPLTDDTEREELNRFQRDICRRVPSPPGAMDIPDFLRE